ncbi:hypothetical protein QYE76_065246 [Lolium multiflorum]|uniref:Retrotransposon gag domain-containing protein n=1 Tax=Lolium multiflorum TaxID=4521 RepID=A0AAD8S9Q5_LOLMU|nr:hypothetical protein QYE76_065246 [Lolium multiflorum]
MRALVMLPSRQLSTPSSTPSFQEVFDRLPQPRDNVRRPARRVPRAEVPAGTAPAVAAAPDAPSDEGYEDYGGNEDEQVEENVLDGEEVEQPAPGRPRQLNRNARPPPRPVRDDDHVAKLKLNIPPFEGRYNPDAYLTWELEVEQRFACLRYPDHLRVSAATCEFTDFASIWWSEHCRVHHANIPTTWVGLKLAMRTRFVPPHYQRDLLKKLSRLEQGKNSVEDYYQELQTGMIRCGIVEDNEAMLARFFGGLNKEIQHILDYKEYNTITRLFHLACKAEREVQDRQPPWRRANISAGRTSSWTPRQSAPPSRGAASAPSTSKYTAPASRAPPAATPPPSAGPPRSSSSMASTGKTRDIQCRKCLGFGHIERECRTKRVMLVREDGEYDSASDFDEDTLALIAARDGANSDSEREMETVAIPYTCGSSRLFSGAVAGEHSFIWKFTWIDIVRCKFSIMGKPRDTKIAILPSTTRKGTTLSTSAALDSPSVISKLVSPPQASNAGTSAESENSSHNCDDASAVLDNDGSLGSFLDATIARSRQIENTETPNENADTPVNSPESVEYSSDDLDEDYVELDDDFIEKCNATTDARKIKKLLAEHAVRYKLSPDPKFATSPINIRDKDYDFSLDLSHIAIVEKTPFCGTEKESAVEHMTELSTLSGLFSDDIKMRTYFVAKIFPFSLKDDAKTWYNNLPPGSIKSPKELLDVFFRKYFPASAQHAALQRIYNFDQEDGEKLPEAWARFCSLIRAQPDHDLEKHDLLDIFYSGLTIESRAYLDSCAGCVFRKRTPDDAEELLAKIGRNHDDWSTIEPTPTPIVKKRGMIKLNDEDMREAKKSLKEKGIKPEDVKNLPPIEDICETIPPSSMIEVHSLQRFTREDIPYSKPPAQCLDEFDNYIVKQENFNMRVENHLMENSRAISELHGIVERTSNDVKILVKHFQMVQTQIDQLTKVQNDLLGNNSKEKHAYEVTTRGGASTQDPLYPEGHPKRVEQDSQLIKTSAPSKKKKKKHKNVVESSEPVNDPNSISISDAETESGNEHDKDNDKNDTPDKEEIEKEPEKPAKNKKYTKEDFITEKHGNEREPWVQKQMPFPAKKLKSKEEEHYNKFCDWMKPLFLQIPLTDAIKLPPYSKYMKDIVTNKRKVPNEEISTMLANYSFNGKIPKKLGDPGIPTIPCSIKNNYVRTALCDLGAGVSVMPFSLYKRLDLDKLIPTDISLQMADKSTAIPVGLCENVPVQVTQHCLILTDFVVLEMPEDDNMSIILGRPFLNTAGAVIDCNKGMVTFNVDDKEHTVYFPKRIDKDFEFHRSQTNPMVRNGWSITENELNAYIERESRRAREDVEEAEEHPDSSSDAASSSYQHHGHVEPPRYSSAQGPYYHSMYDPPAWNSDPRWE